MHVLLRSEPTSTVEALTEAVGELLARTRRLISGEREEALMITALGGLAVSPGVRIWTPWGDLRAATPTEQMWQPGERGPFARAPEAILESTVPLGARIGEAYPGQDDSFRDLTISTRILVGVERVSLAVLLAQGDARPVAPWWLWQTLIAPFGYEVSDNLVGRAFTFRALGPRRQPTPTTLTAEEQPTIKEWSERVEEHYDPAIDVAVRRTLSAVRERADSADALIDAVISWENLFGHGEASEVMFRVTAALAHLLEKDPRKRAKFQGDLKKIYGLRSRVLHGGEVKPKDDLEGRKEAAIAFSVRALRELFLEKPHLVAEKERGMQLILGTVE